MYDKFIKIQLAIVFSIMLGVAMAAPVIAKLQGVMFTTTIIAVYMIFNNLGSFFLKYLKHLTTKQSYKFLIILNGTYFVSLFTYFISPVLFIYVVSSVSVVLLMFTNIYSINYKAYIMKRYSGEIFRDIQFTEKAIISGASIVGYGVTIIVSNVTTDMSINVLVIAGVLLVGVLSQTFNYITQWRDIE